ncbi:M23 family metallopeptidase [Sporomusa acidovorans]|uniref:M23ase beta-sheet core domain-containing protein n=1 Tax=Sporomusa acidovorans (strain ATCC 49682 / DSM 3132 / Mol) TaxID=1123286 RepID=A0ABZ3J8M8_SPOA4|nr:M23 family metallopeptidase [Sporomusa acidovorans]OZC19264.1 peptidase family M23 [Sporomusa acidovorans DSM 3132]SDD82736.1 Murein DD-endopeptidase MepM and murein hydrolase activator NlpD, contain LysM domain [Sporomusa acidovorans]
MPGKIITKVTRFSQLGPIVTAAILLSLASLLLFIILSTMNPSINPPASKSSPVAEEVVPSPLAPATDIPPAASGATAEVSPAIDDQIQQKANSDDSGYDGQTINDLKDGTILYNFGWQFQPVYQDWRYHNGVDIGGEEGQIVPVLANGEVLSIYTDAQYGLTVVVKSGQYAIYYSSLASVAIQEKTAVKVGRPIGAMGISLAEPEPHLHLAVQLEESREYIDPQELFPAILKAE